MTSTITTPEVAEQFEDGSAYVHVQYGPFRKFVAIEADRHENLEFGSAAARDLAAMLLDAADRLDAITDAETTEEAAWADRGAPGVTYIGPRL